MPELVDRDGLQKTTARTEPSRRAPCGDERRILHPTRLLRAGGRMNDGERPVGIRAERFTKEGKPLLRPSRSSSAIVS